MRWLRQGAAVLAMVTAALVGYEGFSSLPYQDEAGVWTNGFGHTSGVTASTPPVDKPTALRHMEADVYAFQRLIDTSFKRPVGPNATVAYTSLAYNIGPTAFKNSSVVRRHNAGDFIGACNAILMWNKIRVRGVLTYSKGLNNRRQAERLTCLKDY